ncbi:hypothetical protein [Dictyobacter kobayashii]|uniref:Uncharacterized protein n=1 Tax=Dictyobacter kobayashii TaxID=2014872 RepID=A0A402ARD5_9CHLR|nr:hypothetical protein [Dictyobacter kobayashii]GCE21655.1 hypothetical protein KDK_54550 [Dictyobacter kobayashii]
MPFTRTPTIRFILPEMIKSIRDHKGLLEEQDIVLMALAHRAIEIQKEKDAPTTPQRSTRLAP